MAIVEEQYQAELLLLRESGLFDAAFVLARNVALASSGIDPLEYFCRQGWRRGEWPNAYFDTAYYLANNQDVAQAGMNPLLHYLAHGDREGRRPSEFFQVKWYRAKYGVALAQNCLAHFLARRISGDVAPVPFFDAMFYLEQNPDVATNGGDPFEHFLAFGAPELRDPSPEFDIKFYVARYGGLLEGQNPLLHFLAHKESGKFVPARPEHEKLIPGAVRTATRPSDYFEEFRPVPAEAERRAKVLAFYLPQFHKVPENDAWWGKGFSDWTNLMRAVPRFAGHLQPRAPRDLGFYNLADPAVLRRQVELAVGAGLHGFVFYYYWFNGKRLLETPLEMLLGDASLKMPFCVMWANENFTRRWDGLEREILLAQEYRDDDDEGLIDGFCRLFGEERYICIGRRPLLMIYRASLIPDAAKRIAKWRKMFAVRGKNPVLVMAQSIGDHDPAPYGLDGAVEFPPHKISDEVATINATLDLFDPEFSAGVYDYAAVAEAALSVPEPGYHLIRTVAPGWDNDPRREGKGLVLHGATPDLYQRWLEGALEKASEKPFLGERIVCVNAWNEWAEGAFLEPDVHFGAAFLNATARAVCGTALRGQRILLLVGHDAQPHGAQLLLLNLARHYHQVWGFEVQVLLLGAGRLVQEYEAVATVTLTNDKAAVKGFCRRMGALGVREAIVNSAAAARLVPILQAEGMRVTLLVHEMPMLLAEYNLQMQAKLGALAADAVVFAAREVDEAFCAALEIELKQAVVLAQGNYQGVTFDGGLRARARRALGVADGGFVVMGAGFGDLRKGFDLFVQLAGKLADRGDVIFVWVGDVQPVLRTYLGAEIAALGDRLRLAGFSDAVQTWFCVADVFALTSREDPYPTVVLEALSAGLMVAGFEGSGGVPALLRGMRAGSVARMGDVGELSRKVAGLLDRGRLDASRRRLVGLAAQTFDQVAYARGLLRVVRPALKAVSVCVLNYNYERYLRGRLESVFAQTYPVCEILVLDDASTDGSVELAVLVAQDAGRGLIVAVSERNSGSVFGQWRRAVEMAAGEFIWLAEADDGAAPAFLGVLVEAMSGDEGIVMGLADSQVVGAGGELLAADYQGEYRRAGVDLSVSAVWEGVEFARRFLAARNLIFNVSGVVWRRAALLRALSVCGGEAEGMNVAGDWRVYLEVAMAPGAKVAVVAEALNRHRRHGASATVGTDGATHVEEIERMQRLAARRLKLDKAARAGQARYLAEARAHLIGDLPA